MTMIVFEISLLNSGLIGEVGSSGAPTPAGTSVFSKHNWDMEIGYLWLNGWGIYDLMGGVLWFNGWALMTVSWCFIWKYGQKIAGL